MRASVHADVERECCGSLADAVSRRHSECVKQQWDNLIKGDKVTGWARAAEAMSHAAFSGDTVGMSWLLGLGAPLEPSVTKELGRRGELTTLKVACQSPYYRVLEAAAEGAGVLHVLVRDSYL